MTNGSVVASVSAPAVVAVKTTKVLFDPTGRPIVQQLVNGKVVSSVRLLGGKVSARVEHEGQVYDVRHEVEKTTEGVIHKAVPTLVSKPEAMITAPISIMPTAEAPTIAPTARMTAAEQMKALGFGVAPEEAYKPVTIPTYLQRERIGMVEPTIGGLPYMTITEAKPELFRTGFITPELAIAKETGLAVWGRPPAEQIPFIMATAPPLPKLPLHEEIKKGVKETFGIAEPITFAEIEARGYRAEDVGRGVIEFVGGAVAGTLLLPVTTAEFLGGIITKPVETVGGILPSIKYAFGAPARLGEFVGPALTTYGVSKLTSYLREPVTYPKVREVAIFEKPTTKVGIHPEFEELFIMKGKVSLIREVTPAVTRGQLFLQKAFPAFVKPKVEYYIGGAKFAGLGIVAKEPFPQAIMIGKAKIPMPKGMKEIPFMAKREIAWEAPLAVGKLRGIEYGFLEAERIGKVVAAGRGKVLQVGKIETPFAIREFETFEEIAGVQKIAAKPVYIQKRMGEFEIIRPKVEFAKLFEVKPARAITPPKPPEVIARPVLPEKPVFYWEQPAMFKAPPVKVITTTKPIPTTVSPIEYAKYLQETGKLKSIDVGKLGKGVLAETRILGGRKIIISEQLAKVSDITKTVAKDIKTGEIFTGKELYSRVLAHELRHAEQPIPLLATEAGLRAVTLHLLPEKLYPAERLALIGETKPFVIMKAPKVIPTEVAPKPVVTFAPQVAEAVVKITTVKRAVGVMPEIKLALGEVVKPISKMFPLRIKELPIPKPIFAPLFMPPIVKARVVTAERVAQIPKMQQLTAEIPKTMQLPKALEWQIWKPKIETMPKVIPRVTTRQIQKITPITETLITTLPKITTVPPIFAPTIPRLPIAPYLPQVPYGAPPIFRAAYRLPKRAPPKLAYKPSLYGMELGARIRKAPRFVAGGAFGIRPMVIVPRARPSRAPVAPPRKRESTFGFLRRTAVFLGGTAKPPIPTANIRMRMPSFTARTPKRRMPDLRRLL